jgi:hypothetical protein
VVDLFVSDTKVYLIELNPFFGDTGACLFSWRESADNEIMKSGPFEFRILEKPMKFPLECFPFEWQTFIAENRKQSHEKIWILIGVAVILIGIGWAWNIRSK